MAIDTWYVIQKFNRDDWEELLKVHTLDIEVCDGFVLENEE